MISVLDLLQDTSTTAYTRSWESTYMAQPSQTEAVAHGSMASVSTTAIPLFATTHTHSELADSIQSAADATSTAIHMTCPEYHQQSQTDADIMNQITDTTFSENRIYRQKQAPFKCRDCNKTFARSDVLRRHRNEKHAARIDEYLCPSMGCKKSQKGHGFKRRDKLKKHEMYSCKGRVRAISWNQSSASTSTMTVSTPDDTTNAHSIHQESSPFVRADDTAISSVITLQNQDVISKLQTRSRTEEEALFRKEKECQGGRERLASLQTVIRLYENEPFLNQGIILDLQRRCRAEEDATSIKEEESQEMRKHLASLHAVIELYQSSSPTTSI